MRTNDTLSAIDNALVEVLVSVIVREVKAAENKNADRPGREFSVGAFGDEDEQSTTKSAFTTRY